MLNNTTFFDGAYNNVDYGMGRTLNTEIALSPLVSDIYKESTTDDIGSILSNKEMEQLLYEEFKKSPWFEKYQYNGDKKKLEKGDMKNVFQYFHEILVDNHNYNEVDAFCCIAEFFGMSDKDDYKTLYQNALTVVEKTQLLHALKDKYGLSKEFGKINRLF